MEVILASASPGRRELLRRVIKEFRVLSSNIEEGEVCGVEDVCKRAEVLALKKAEKIAKDYPDALIIGGDTIVEMGGVIYGKPKNEDEAMQILRQLRGTLHRVITGIAIVCENRGIHLVSSEVSYTKMRDNITDEEIENYVKTGEGRNKAGGYAVQEKGDRFIERIDGDYYNVVGFPLKKLCTLLKKAKDEWNLELSFDCKISSLHNPIK